MDQQTWFLQLSKEQKEALYFAELENYSEKMVVNLEGRIVFINAKYADEFHSTPEQIEGMMVEDLVKNNSRLVPPILDMPDFESPYVPYAERVQGEGRPPSMIRAPLRSGDGTLVGYMFYDGMDWLQRYRSLYDKLNEMEDQYYYHATKGSRPASSHLVGESEALQHVKRLAISAGRSNATVLIEGATGTGKEVIANTVYAASRRSGKPFVKLNCAAIPKELAESELFGYEDGAFTGARRGGKMGLFESADGGTILLDEINSLDLATQAKLLRVLQERAISRVGGHVSTPIDVRVIAISNRPLEELVAEGSFREDLFYRLNVLHIHVPLLRERPEDIPALVHRFVELCNQEMDKHVDTIDPRIYDMLKRQSWPGNVRQLQNWVERAMASVWKRTLTLANFYWVTPKLDSSGDEHEQERILVATQDHTLSEIMAQVEAQVIANTLKSCGGNKSRAASILGISRQMLHRKLRSRPPEAPGPME